MSHSVPLNSQGFARDAHPPGDVGEAVRRVGVGMDRRHATAGEPGAQRPPVEVQPVGIGVELRNRAVEARRLEDRIEVELVGLAHQQEAARGMSEEGHAWV